MHQDKGRDIQILVLFQGSTVTYLSLVHPKKDIGSLVISCILEPRVFQPPGICFSGAYTVGGFVGFLLCFLVFGCCFFLLVLF